MGQYEYFYTTEKFVHTVVPQLFQDCMKQFKEQLVVEFETYLNGQKIHHDQLAVAIPVNEKQVCKRCKGNDNNLDHN